MTRIAVAYVATALVFLALDAGWLTVAGAKLYKPEIGELLADKVRLAPAAIFYFLYVGGLVYFAVAPNLDAGWTKALVAGAVLGVVAYGAYDLTCAATMKIWSTKVTVADIVWGGFASGAASAAAVLITRLFIRSTGA